MQHHDFTKPFIFISTPSMNTNANVLCPEGTHTMEIVTIANFDYFQQLFFHNPQKYRMVQRQLADHILDIIEKQYVPDLRKHIAEKIVKTPVDVYNTLSPPKGNIYGISMTPQHYNFGKITSRTPWNNLYFVGATSSFPGIMGVILGSMSLFRDEFEHKSQAASSTKQRRGGLTMDVRHAEANL